MISHLRGRRALASAVVALAVAGVTGTAALAHEGPHDSAGTSLVATLRSSWAVLKPVDGSGVTGMVGIRQKAKRVTLSIVVTGLEPGSTHAAHVHGPGTCAKPTKRHATELDDLVADEHGVAQATVTRSVSEQIVGGKKAYYVYVHANPSSADMTTPNPPIACADIAAG